MSTLKKLTENEYQAVKRLYDLMKETSKLGEENDSNINDFFDNKDVTMQDVDNVLYDIKNDELFQEIEKYKSGETTAAAHDSDGVGFTVVEILHGMYDNVFGFTEFSGVITYYLCETSDSYNEELERDEIHFFVDNEPVILNDCIRTNIGGF